MGESPNGALNHRKENTETKMRGEMKDGREAVIETLKIDEWRIGTEGMVEKTEATAVEIKTTTGMAAGVSRNVTKGANQTGTEDVTMTGGETEIGIARNDVAETGPVIGGPRGTEIDGANGEIGIVMNRNESEPQKSVVKRERG